MHKLKARWIAFLTAILLICSFAFAACDGENGGDLGAIRDIYIVTADLKTTYTVGEEFDYSAVKLRAVYENGDESLTAADADKGVTHTDLDMSKAGTQTLTVTYKEKSASVAINVVAEEKAVLKGLQFSGGATAYTVGDAIDYHAFTLTAIYSVGDDRALYGDSQGVTHNDISTAAAGTPKLTFTYTDGGVSKSVTVTITVSAAPAPVTLVSVEVQSSAADRSVAFGAEFDYSKFTIVPHYSDGHSVSSLNGTSEGVTHTTVDTTVPGDQELTFTYEEVTSAPVTITVLAEKLNLKRFSLPKFYSDVAANEGDTAGTESADRDSFMTGFESYKAGDDNAFEFQPDATVLLSSTQELAVTVQTQFTLEKKAAGGEFEPVDNADTYVKTTSVLPNYYWFQPAAVGNVFKLRIKPDPASYTGATEGIEAIIEVVDGYNVYNQIGLSVFDNLNVKHWQSIKEEAGTLRWDTKPLVKYNTVTGDDKAPVKNIILHSNITIDPDELPDNYFWQKDETVGDSSYNTVNGYLQTGSEIPDSVKNNLEGSLKDGLNKDYHYKFDDVTSGDYKEDIVSSVNMQKGIYVSTGTGIVGNFHTLTYHTSGSRHSLYTVYDGKNATGTAFPLSHWSLFKYSSSGMPENVERVNDGKPTVSDLRILGQSPRLAATDGEPSHLMAFNGYTSEINLSNCIVSRLFVAVLGDTSTNVNVADSKIFDIYSNMFYLWRAKADVKNSILMDAGGPLFILCDGNRKQHDYDSLTFSQCPLDDGTPLPGDQDEAAKTRYEKYKADGPAPNLVVDDKSKLESFAAGEESWYKLNGVSEMFGKIKGGSNNGLGDVAKGYLGRDIIVKKDNVDLVNVIAVIIPEPSEMSNKVAFANSITTSGMAKIGDETFKMHPVTPTFNNQFLASAALQTFYNSHAPYFISGGKVAIYGQTSMQNLGGGQYGFEDVIASTTGTQQGNWAFKAADVKAAWASVTSPYLFISTRPLDATFSGQTVTEASPRIGILVGSVHSVTA